MPEAIGDRVLWKRSWWLPSGRVSCDPGWHRVGRLLCFKVFQHRL